LRDLGHECEHVAEIGMWKAADDEILAYALEKRAVVVTLDADFRTILAVRRASGPSVIRLRVEGLRAPDVVRLLQDVLSGFEAELRRGSLVTVKSRKTTSHRLPIGSTD
jgi:predicted nuclease of predicted toxin-antitoxin system